MPQTCTDLLLWLLGVGRDFFFAIVSAWIGAWLGIRWAKREAHAQDSLRQERIKTQLIAALEFNLKQTEQAHTALKEGRQPNFPLDAIKLNAIVVDAYGIISPNLWKDIEWGNYQFQHLHDKMQILNTAFLVISIGNQNANLGQSPLLQAHRTSMMEHSNTIVKGTPILIARLKAETKPSQA